MALSTQLRNQIEAHIANDSVVIFMKGNRQQPQCGFSATVVDIFNSVLPVYTTINVLENPELREGIKEYSNWPTIPQIYIKGEFVGGCDIAKELFANGELFDLLGLKRPSQKTPIISITPAAAEAFTSATQDAGDEEGLRLGISASYEHELYYGEEQPNDIKVEQNGVCLFLDPLSASRADGLKIDYNEGPAGAGFQLDNPNAPAPIKQLTVEELKTMLDKGETFYFFDVRTPEEHQAGAIPGARLISTVPQAELAAIAKDAPIVFHCRSGGRSQRAAEEFRMKGYTNLFNVVGGILAWEKLGLPTTAH